VAELTDLLRPAEGAGPAPATVEPGREPFFCFEFGIALSRHLGPDLPVHVLDYLAVYRQHGRIETLAAELVRQMRQVQPHGPYYLGGVCRQGLVALEMARQLRDSGEEVALVAVIEPFRAPLPRGRARYTATLLRRNLFALAALLGHGLFDLVVRTPLRQWPGVLARKARSGWGWFVAPLLTWALGLSEENSRAIRLGYSIATYEPTYPERVAFLLAAEQPPWADPQATRAALKRLPIREMEVYQVPGVGHVEITSREGSARLAETIGEAVHKARGRRRRG
jgi:thioesterase domain-containing protein